MIYHQNAFYDLDSIHPITDISEISMDEIRMTVAYDVVGVLP